jgi:hypothetical protein
MMRNMIRHGIRAVRNGGDLDYRILRNGSAIPTYCHDRVVAGVAQAPTPQEDRKLLHDVARNLVAETVKAVLAGG